MDILFDNILTKQFLAMALGKGLRILFILMIAIIAYHVIKGIISRIMGLRIVHLTEVQQRRTDTLVSLTHSVLAAVFSFIAIIMVLNELNVDTTSLLAGASIIALAIGVGAQSLVKDIVAGIFIILENQFYVGDIVTIKGFTGTVTDMSLRTTKVCSADKVIHTIPNGMIDIVSNYTRGVYIATIRIAVSQSSDPDVVLENLQKALDIVSQRSDVHENGACVGGIVSMEGNSLIYEVSIPARRGDAYGVSTAYRYEAAKLLAAAHVPLPRFIIEPADMPLRVITRTEAQQAQLNQTKNQQEES